MKNIDTAFRYIRLVSLAVILGLSVVTCVAIYKGYEYSGAAQDRLYVLINGKALEAYASDRKENIPVEVRDHVQMFHQYFFTLSPDESNIKENITKALYLADGSAKRMYDDLTEKNYYGNLISGNVSQTIRVDSIQLKLDDYPYSFRCFAKQEITRPTSTVIRNLITEGFVRNVARSSNNPHGFLIERWTTLENRDINVKSR
ncbi:conjugative transposon protein TraK [Chitinophaga barathri]|nr:conjugative transposon protein TraK [Chitinophaga barathri]